MKSHDFARLITRIRRGLHQRFSVPPTQEGRNIRLLYLDMGWRGILTAGVARFLPVFMARLGASSLMISALTSVPALIMVFVSMPASTYIERQHNHVRTASIFRALAFSTYVILAVLPFFFRESLPLAIVALWCLQVIPSAFSQPAFVSVLGASVSPGKRPAVNGGRWALSSVVSAIAAIIFGKLLDSGWLPFPENYQIVFFISAVAGLISIVYFSKIKLSVDYATEPPANQTLRERISQMITPILQTPEFMRYLGATFFVRWGLVMPIALYSIYWVRDLNASDTVIGLRTTAEMVSLIIGYSLFGRIAALRGHRKVLIASSIGLGLYPILTALTPNQYWLLPAALLNGFFLGGFSISIFESLLGTAPPEKRPSFSAFNTVFANLASVVGPLLGAALMTLLGIKIAFYIAGALHIIGAALCWKLGVGLESER